MLWLAVASIAQAQGKGGDLRAAMQNPISSLISLPFESNYDSGADSGDAFFVSIQPVVPVTVGDWNLVSRLILPRGKVDGEITGLPINPSPIPDEGADGLSDTNDSLIFSFSLLWTLEMTKDNRYFFALASYNAGSGRIGKYRKRAPEVGYDPNKWFGNVERVSLRSNNLETVMYVRNIFNYTMAYKSACEQSLRRDEINEGKNREPTVVKTDPAAYSSRWSIRADGR